MPRKLLLLIGSDVVLLLGTWLAILADAPSWMLLFAVGLIAAPAVAEARMIAAMNRGRR